MKFGIKMHDPQLVIETKFSGLETNEWFGSIDDYCETNGFFEQLGQHHCAAFVEGNNQLIVTFENAEKVRANNTGAEPRGFAYARHEGWSHLAILSFSESWFRDEAIFDFFDRLTDQGFFEDFERVVFHGAIGGGYAAAAYSVVAPGATVVALCPQATLDAEVAGWDPRYKSYRKHGFTGRYGYAPEMIEAADEVFVAYDPLQRLDAIHAALFKQQHVTLLPCRLIGGQLDRAFDRLGIHDAVIKLAMEGALTRRRFMQLLRARRYDQTYARSLVRRLKSNNHDQLAALTCAYMLQRGKSPYFLNILREITNKRSSDHS